MSRQSYQTLFAYSWATAQRLLDKAALLDEAELHANPGYGHGSIYDLFLHLLNVSHGWRGAFETGTEWPRFPNERFTKLDAVRAALEAEYSGWHALLAALSDEDVADTVRLKRTTGEEGDVVRWRIFQHLTLHAMQHHTEIAHWLTRKGQSPGDIDFLFYQG